MHKKCFNLPVNSNVENSQNSNWSKIEENQVQPIYIDLLWNNIITYLKCQG